MTTLSIDTGDLSVIQAVLDSRFCAQFPPFILQIDADWEIYRSTPRPDSSQMPQRYLCSKMMQNGLLSGDIS